RLRTRIEPSAQRAFLRGMLINLALNAFIALQLPVDNAAHLGGLLTGFLLGLAAPLVMLERRPWHRSVQIALVGCAFLLAALEGAAFARAVHPHSRTLRGPGVEARVHGLLAPLTPGVAECPMSMAISIAHQEEPLSIKPGDDAVRFGDRTLLRQREGGGGGRTPL